MKFLWERLGVIAFWVGWPISWLALRNSRRTRLLMMSGDEVLVVRGWLSDGRWQLPGGGLHHREDPLQGVVRETREETGLTVVSATVQSLGSEPFTDKGFRFECYYFMAALDQPARPRLKGLEITRAVWVRRSDLNPVNSGRDVLRALALFDKKPSF